MAKFQPEGGLGFLPVDYVFHVSGKPHPTPIGWKAMGPMLIPPKVKVTKLEKGKEKCERHVKKMVVRGEQIAFISVSGT